MNNRFRFMPGIMRMAETAAVLMSALWMTACGARSPEASPRTDAGMLMELARRNVAFGVRHSGTEALKKSGDWILSELRSVPGMTTEEDVFTEATPAGKIEFRNLIGTLKGADDSGFIVLAAHYDGKFFADPGSFQAANDGASGTAVLLGMAQTLKNITPPVTLKFVFFDGEECRYSYNGGDGLHGSRHLANRWKESGVLKKCRGLLLLDMIGDKDLHITLPADSPKDLVRIILNAAQKTGVEQHVSANGPVMLDDHVPFRDAGVKSVDLIDFSYGPGNGFWHSSGDTLENISGESMKITADLVFAAVWQIANE